MAEGYAVIINGEPDMRTVAESKRAAMVNGLAAIFGHMVCSFDTDEAIVSGFERLALHHDCKPHVSKIQCTIVEPK